ncbi:MAG: DNA polymerase III subunit beta [Thermodesulfobacteriota bacterium]
MQFSIQKAAFLEALTKVQGIAGRKTSFPITQNLLLSAEEESLALSATDLEVGFSGRYPAVVAQAGKTTVPARKLYEIVKEFPSDAVDVSEMENGWVKIGDDRLQFTIVSMDPADFPKLPEIEETSFATIEAAALKDLVDKVNLAGGVAAEEKRPHLIGVFLTAVPVDAGIVLRMVSTDGNRLAMSECAVKEVEPGFLPEKGAIVPKKVMAEVAKLLEDDRPVRLGVKGNYFVLVLNGETLISRLVEGDYPDYTMVIPKGIETQFTTDRAAFTNTLKRMSILSSERYRAVRFSIAPDLLTVRIVNPDIGESKESLPVSFNGPAIETSFNARYFLDAAAVMRSEKIRVRIKDAERACIVEGDEDPGYISVIMPMRA